MRKQGLWFTAGMLTATSLLYANVMTYSSGELTPETISAVPSGFNIALNGSYLVPDNARFNPANYRVWAIASDGTATQFGDQTAYSPMAGTFVTVQGQQKYMTIGFQGATAFASVWNGDGTRTDTTLNASDALWISGITKIDANTFLVTDQNHGTVLRLTLDTDGTPSLSTVPVASLNGFLSAYDITAVPNGFGALGGGFLISSGVSGPTSPIYYLDPSGDVSIFANIPDSGALKGLRQIEFAPSTFDSPYAGDLFVSVSGSVNGGGSLGALDVVDSTGAIIAQLKLGDAGKFDPRGVYFSNTSLLINDASDPILFANASDLTPVATPEPTTIGLVGLAIAAAGLISRRLRLS